MAKGTLKISGADAFTAADLAPNSVDTSELAADAVTGAQIADDAIDSEHYADGSIDTAHIGNLQVTAAKVAADVATQAELDARVSAATTAAQGVGTGDTPKFDSIKTKTNNYAYITGVEDSSKGMFQQNFNGVEASLIANAYSTYSSGWTEIAGGTFNGWTENWSSDQFGNFAAANGRFTPGIGGWVHCMASIRILVNSTEHGGIGFVRNGSMNNVQGYQIMRFSPGESDSGYGTLATLMYCDSNDYISVFTFNNGSNTETITTESWVAYQYVGGTL